METIHTFAGNPLDRGEALRRDDEAVDRLRTDPRSRFLAFDDALKVAAGDDGLRWLTREELPEGALEGALFLGTDDDGAYFCVTTDGGEDFQDCRGIAARLETAQTGLLAQARAQLAWHQRNRHCTLCAGAMLAERGGQVRRCSDCGDHIFPRTDPVAIMCVIDEPGGDRCLLGRPQGRIRNPKFFTCLAGFLDQGESLEEAVRREVAEEAGIEVGAVRYHSSQPWPFPSQLMIGCHAVATTQDIRFDEVEMADVRWFSRAEARAALSTREEALSVPGELAIAHHLIKSWVDGDVDL